MANGVQHDIVTLSVFEKSLVDAIECIVIVGEAACSIFVGRARRVEKTHVISHHSDSGTAPVRSTYQSNHYSHT